MINKYYNKHNYRSKQAEEPGTPERLDTLALSQSNLKSSVGSSQLSLKSSKENLKMTREFKELINDNDKINKKYNKLKRSRKSHKTFI